MLTGRDVDAAEAERIGLVSRVVARRRAARRVLRDRGAHHRLLAGVGVEVTKRMLWSSLDAASLRSTWTTKASPQLYVRCSPTNFEEAIRARREKRTPVFRDTRG